MIFCASESKFSCELKFNLTAFVIYFDVPTLADFSWSIYCWLSKVWAIAKNGEVYVRQGVTESLLFGTHWSFVSGQSELSYVSLDCCYERLRLS